MDTRELVISSTHRLAFTCCLGAKCEHSELTEIKKKYAKFSLLSISRINKVLTNTPLCRFHKNGDLTVMAPWGVLKEDITFTYGDGEDQQISRIEKHSFLICISETNVSCEVFMPCGGPDPETD